MPFHHFLPPPHIVGFVLTSALAFTAGAYLMSRRRLTANLGEAGANMQSRFKEWRQAPDGLGSRMSTMFSKCANTRSDRRNSTGNAAFEEYRSATLTGLNQEAAAFRKYLNELRNAKDKSEFDAFLDERRLAPTTGTSSP